MTPCVRISSVFGVVCFAVVASLAGACVEMDDPIVDPPDIELEAGIAEADGLGFAPIVDGSDFVLEPGAQGGFHVWVNLRVHGLAGEYYVERDAVDAVGHIVTIIGCVIERDEGDFVVSIRQP